MNPEKHEQSLARVISQLLTLVVALLLLIIGLVIALVHYMPEYIPPKDEQPAAGAGGNSNAAAQQVPADTVKYWTPPAETSLEGNPAKDSIMYGKELIAHTSKYFGPKGIVSMGATNGLNCQNCHLDAGTKIFGNNYSAVASTYPKYRARSGTKEDMPKRINDCFERSLDGQALKIDSKEMHSIMAYIKWLGTGVAKGEKPAGSGLKEIAFLDRAASPEKGKVVYAQKCQSCHQPNGEGFLNEEKTEYTYPPLWGSNSYNTGAGLYRLSNFAKFVKYNMPLGASHINTQLTDEEAWDIAAFVNSQPRPSKDIKSDWPKPEEKPFDHPFGPYKDGFNEEQHKYGPYQPIIDARKKK